MYQLLSRCVLGAVAICGVSGFAQTPEDPSRAESERPRGYVRTDNMAYERPYSAAYKTIGDKVYIVLKGVSGEMVAISEPLDMLMPDVLPKDEFLLGEGNTVSYGPEANHHCSVKVNDVTYETTTHMVTVITTETWCNGELVDVTVTVVRVRKPAPEAPDEQ